MAESRSTTSGAFSAADLRRRVPEREAQKVADELRRMKEQEEKQKAVMAEFHQPPARTSQQLVQLVIQLINQAAERGQTEVQVYRFPNSLCTNGGRRINNCCPTGRKPGGPAQARIRILGGAPKTAWLWAEGAGSRISGRDAQ